MQHVQAATAEAGPTSKFAQVNRVKLHYLDWGGDSSHHTILLCHGGSAHAHWWDDVAPQLVEYGNVLALDFRGHGRSSWTASYGLATYLQDLTAFIRDHVRKRVVLLGHSMGGEVSMRLAVDNPELLEGLVIADAVAGGPPLKTRLMWRWKRRNQGGARPEFGTKDALIARFRLSPPGHNLAPEAIAALALKGAEQLSNGNWAFRFDPSTRKLGPGWRLAAKCRIQDIRMPVLILRGEHSKLVAPRRAQRMHRRIRGSILKTIPSAYHHISLDNPEGTATAVADFIELLERKNGPGENR